MKDLMTVLDYRSLGKMYQDASREAVQLNPLYNMYTAGTPEQFDTDEVEFIKIGYVKDQAPTNSRDGAARGMQLTGKSRRKLQMLNFFNVIKLNQNWLQMLRDPEAWRLQNKGAQQELDQQTADFATRHSITKQIYLSKSLTEQTIYIGENGKIYETDPSSGYTVSTGLPSGNISTVGGIIDKYWSDPSCAILDQLDLLTESAEIAGTEPLRHVWLYRKNKKWIRNNEQILDIYGAGQERLDNAVKGDTFEINGYTFHFYGGTYETATGSTGYFIPTTKAIVTPEPGKWLMNGVGLQRVPTEVGIVNQQNGTWTDVYGDGSYVFEDHNPPRLDFYAFSNWLFGLRNPASIYVPTVSA